MDRTNLIDLMTPPRGFCFACGAGMVYSADEKTVGAMLRALNVAYDARARERFERGESFRLFVQQGNYDGAARNFLTAVAPRGGCLHAKVFCLRFERGDECAVRVLAASANLTNADELNVYAQIDRTGDAAETLWNALAVTPRAWDEEDPETAVRGLLHRCAEQTGLIPVTRATLAALEREAESAEKTLVVSPFLTAGVLRRLFAGSGEKYLVTRAEALRTAGPLPKDVSVLTLESRDGGGDLAAALHAKLYAFESGGKTVLCLGSANATASAFAKNIEVLARLEEKRGVIDAIVSAFTPCEGAAAQEADGALIEEKEFDAACRDILASFRAQEREYRAEAPAGWRLALDGREGVRGGTAVCWEKTGARRRAAKLTVRDEKGHEKTISLLLAGEPLPVDREALERGADAAVAEALRSALRTRATSDGVREAVGGHGARSADAPDDSLPRVLGDIDTPEAAHRAARALETIAEGLPENDARRACLAGIAGQVRAVWADCRPKEGTV